MTLLQLFLYFDTLKPLDGDLFIDDCTLCTQQETSRDPYSAPVHLEQELTTPTRFAPTITETYR